jgi:hypothetical protein
MLFPVWLQLDLFPHSAEHLIQRADLRPMNDSERDKRSGSQWRRSIEAYLTWRAGEAWRRSSDRNSSERWYYLDAVRLLNGIGFVPLASPTPISCRALTPATDSLPSSTALVNELMQLRPELSARRTLMHFQRVKLARMVEEARATVASSGRAA